MMFNHGGLRLSLLVVMKFGFSNAFVVSGSAHSKLSDNRFACWYTRLKWRKVTLFKTRMQQQRFGSK